MNERDDNHDFDPKHRIVGAVILVALAVIFLPMILNKQPEPPAVAPIAEIPPPDSKVVTAPVAPLEPAPPAATPTAPAGEPANEPAKAPPAVKPAELPPAPAAKQATPEKKPDKPAAKVEKGWVVQVGVFASAENAKHLRDKLRKQGFTAEIDNHSVEAKSMTRVRVGPYRDNAAAKAAQARLQSEAGVKGVVLAYP